MAILHRLPLLKILAISVSEARSTTETSSDGPLAAYRVVPSGEMAMPHGRWPTLIDLVRSPVLASSTQTMPARPVLTYTLLPSCETLTHMGRLPFGSATV